jgi:hypothetical protein
MKDASERTLPLPSDEPLPPPVKPCRPPWFSEHLRRLKMAKTQAPESKRKQRRRVL